MNMQKNTTSKLATPTLAPSKVSIMNWLKSLFNDLPVGLRIEDFGDGVIYCRLLNLYKGNPPHSKIVWLPKNQYDYINNLKHLQTSLLQLDIDITFDVARIAKRKFLENWALINAFYRYFNTSYDIQIEQNFMTTNHGNPTNIQTNAGSCQPSSQLLKHPSHQTLFEQPRFLPPSDPTPLQPTSILEYNETFGLGQLANNSLKITQYLKENVGRFNMSPNKGKWSVGSLMFHNIHNVVADRVKEIILKDLTDSEKIRQITMLLGMPLKEVMKIEDNGPNVIIQNSKIQQSLQNKEMKQNKESKQITQKMNIYHKQAKSQIPKVAQKVFKI